MGSACESEYQLILAHDLAYIDADRHRELEDQLLEVKRMLSSFTTAVRQRANVKR